MDKAKESPYERHAAELAEDHQSGASTNEDNLYGPWMVVKRRKSGYKSSRNSNIPRTSRYLEEGQGPPCATFNRNDNKEHMHESKRKSLMSQTSIGP